MEISVSQQQGNVPVTVIKVDGQLDGQSYQDLIAKARELYDAGARDFLLDFSDLTYISSAGLRVFVLAGKRLDGGKGKILLCSLKNPVREVFDIVGFSATFPVYASHEDALRNI